MASWREKIGVGDELKAFCPKGKTWYSSQVVKVMKNDTLLIHYLGWNSRYDRCYAKDSENLQPVGKKETAPAATKQTKRNSNNTKPGKQGEKTSLVGRRPSSKQLSAGPSCQYDGCRTQAFHGFPEEKQARFCSRHKFEGMRTAAKYSSPTTSKGRQGQLGGTKGRLLDQGKSPQLPVKPVIAGVNGAGGAAAGPRRMSPLRLREAPVTENTTPRGKHLPQKTKRCVVGPVVPTVDADGQRRGNGEVAPKTNNIKTGRRQLQLTSSLKKKKTKSAKAGRVEGIMPQKMRMKTKEDGGKSNKICMMRLRSVDPKSPVIQKRPISQNLKKGLEQAPVSIRRSARQACKASLDYNRLDKGELVLVITSSKSSSVLKTPKGFPIRNSPGNITPKQSVVQLGNKLVQCKQNKQDNISTAGKKGTTMMTANNNGLTSQRHEGLIRWSSRLAARSNKSSSPAQTGGLRSSKEQIPRLIESLTPKKRKNTTPTINSNSQANAGEGEVVQRTPSGRNTRSRTTVSIDFTSSNWRTTTGLGEEQKSCGGQEVASVPGDRNNNSMAMSVPPSPHQTIIAFPNAQKFKRQLAEMAKTVKALQKRAKVAENNLKKIESSSQSGAGGVISQHLVLSQKQHQVVSSSSSNRDQEVQTELDADRGVTRVEQPPESLRSIGARIELTDTDTEQQMLLHNNEAAEATSDAGWKAGGVGGETMGGVTEQQPASSLVAACRHHGGEAERSKLVEKLTLAEQQLQDLKKENVGLRAAAAQQRPAAAAAAEQQAAAAAAAAAAAERLAGEAGAARAALAEAMELKKQAGAAALGRALARWAAAARPPRFAAAAAAAAAAAGAGSERGGGGEGAAAAAAAAATQRVALRALAARPAAAEGQVVSPELAKAKIENALHEVKEKYQASQAQMKLLEREVSEGKEVAAQLRLEVKTAKGNAEDAMQKGKSAHQALQAQMKLLQREVEEGKETAAQLKLEVEGLETAKGNTEDALQKEKSAHEALQAQMKLLQREVAEGKEAAAQLKLEVEGLETAKENAEDALQQEKSAHEALQVRMAEKGKEADASLKLEIEELETAKGNTENALQKEKSAHEALQAQMKLLQREVAEGKEAAAQLKLEVEGLETAKENAEDALQQEKSAHEALLAERKEAAASLKLEVEELETAKGNAEDALQKEKSAHEALQAQMKLLQGEVAEGKEAAAQLKLEVEGLETAKGNAEDALQQEKSAHEALQAQVAERKRTAASLKLEVEGLATAKGNAEDALQKEKSAHEALQAQMKLLQGEVAEGKEAAAQLKLEVEGLETAKGNAEDALQQEKSAHEALQAQMEQVQQASLESKQLNKDYEEQLKALKLAEEAKEKQLSLLRDERLSTIGTLENLCHERLVKIKGLKREQGRAARALETAGMAWEDLAGQSARRLAAAQAGVDARVRAAAGAATAAAGAAEAAAAEAAEAAAQLALEGREHQAAAAAARAAAARLEARAAEREAAHVEEVRGLRERGEALAARAERLKARAAEREATIGALERRLEGRRHAEAAEAAAAHECLRAEARAHAAALEEQVAVAESKLEIAESKQISAELELQGVQEEVRELRSKLGAKVMKTHQDGWKAAKKQNDQFLKRIEKAHLDFVKSFKSEMKTHKQSHLTEVVNDLQSWKSNQIGGLAGRTEPKTISSIEGTAVNELAVGLETAEEKSLFEKKWAMKSSFTHSILKMWNQMDAYRSVFREMKKNGSIYFDVDEEPFQRFSVDRNDVVKSVFNSDIFKSSNKTEHSALKTLQVRFNSSAPGAGGSGGAAAAAAAAAGAPGGGGGGGSGRARATAEAGADLGGLTAELNTLFWDQLESYSTVENGFKGAHKGQRKKIRLFERLNSQSASYVPVAYCDENGNPYELTDSLVQKYEMVGKFFLRSFLNNLTVPSSFASNLLIDCVLNFDLRYSQKTTDEMIADLLAIDPQYVYVKTMIQKGCYTCSELLQNDDPRPLRGEPAREALRAFVHERLVRPREQQFRALANGFFLDNNLNTGPLLEMCTTSKELRLFISGEESFDANRLLGLIDFEGFATNKGLKQIDYFEDVLRGMDQSQLKLFLKFATGLYVIPFAGPDGGRGGGGGAAAAGEGGEGARLKVVAGAPRHPPAASRRGGGARRGRGRGGGGSAGGGGAGAARFPEAHTCHRQLVLPEYENKEEMQERLLEAIRPENSSFRLL